MPNLLLKLALQVLALQLTIGFAGDDCARPTATSVRDQTSLLQEKRERRPRPWASRMEHHHEESLLQTSALSEAHSTASERSTVMSLDMQKRQQVSDRRHRYLDDMFQTATELVTSKEQVTPVVVRFVMDVLSTIDETVLPAIMDEHDEDQQMLVNLFAPIYALENGGMDGEQNVYEVASEEHIECRSSETGHCAIVEACEVREEAAAAVLADKEMVVAEFGQGISEDWCGPSTDKSELSFRNHARPRMRRYLDAEDEADVARDAHAEIVEECDLARAAQQAQRATCDELQRDLESATCVYAFAVNSARRTLIERYEAGVSAYEVASTGVRVSEADRKVEYTVLQQTKCLLGIITNSSNASAEPCEDGDDPDVAAHIVAYTAEADRQMAECHSMHVDTSLLDIHYNDTNGLPSVPDMPLYPCSQEFLTHEYGALSPTDSCAGPSACNPCIGLVGVIDEVQVLPAPVPTPAPTTPAPTPVPPPVSESDGQSGSSQLLRTVQAQELDIGVTNLWSQDWRGQEGGTPPAATQEAGNTWCMASHHCMRQMACGTKGNVFSTEELECTTESPCELSFRHSGAIWQGFSRGFPGEHTWAATSSQSEGRLLATSVTARGQWSRTSYTYPGPTEAETEFLEQRRVMLALTNGPADAWGAGEHLARNPDVPPSVTGRVHLMFETFDHDCDTTVVENIVFRKVDGSRELRYFF